MMLYNYLILSSLSQPPIYFRYSFQFQVAIAIKLQLCPLCKLTRIQYTIIYIGIGGALACQRQPSTRSVFCRFCVSVPSPWWAPQPGTASLLNFAFLTEPLHLRFSHL